MSQQVAAGPATGAPGAPSAQVAWHTLSVDDALVQAGVDASAGLASAEAARRVAQSGPNKFAEGERRPRAAAATQ